MALKKKKDMYFQMIAWKSIFVELAFESGHTKCQVTCV